MQIITLLAIISTISVSSAAPRHCTDVDIRSNMKNLEVIRNCTVIQGYLQLVLLDNATNNFTGVSFPNLHEITGFLMLFRVYGLTDLGKLFPSLIIIRGANLFADYALILYALPDLTRVGLKNLLSIERGFVRIELCYNLCYASTIDWALITHGESVGNVVQKDSAACKLLPACNLCPIKGRCWSHMNCQKSIDDNFWNGTWWWRGGEVEMYKLIDSFEQLISGMSGVKSVVNVMCGTTDDRRQTH